MAILIRLKFYKHVNCSDMVIQALRCVRIAAGWKVKAHYYSLGYDRHTLIDTGNQEEILISNEQIPNWKPF